LRAEQGQRAEQGRKRRWGIDGGDDLEARVSVSGGDGGGGRGGAKAVGEVEEVCGRIGGPPAYPWRIDPGAPIVRIIFLCYFYISLITYLILVFNDYIFIFLFFIFLILCMFSCVRIINYFMCPSFFHFWNAKIGFLCEAATEM
jgi:hypothetical protein